MHKPKHTKVALLLGGVSNEREVSLSSGAQVEQALLNEGYQVTVFDTASPLAFSELISSDLDVAFIALHGKGGEDGSIQGFLETIGLPYTGSGVLASALAMDKFQTKRVYVDCGIPTPPARLIMKDDVIDADEIMSELGEKCVVKPVDDGSAVGVTIASSKEELISALETGKKNGTSCLVERYVAGVEITVGVIDNPDSNVLPVIEIVPVGHQFYDYTAKYSAGGSQHLIPARLDEETTERAQECAMLAHKNLGCRGMSRTDMIVEKTGDVWVLETNTIPGMTPTSLLPDAAAHIGLSFGKLCSLLVEDALRK